MKFWDASAIMPILLDEAYTGELRGVLKDDNSMVVWWGTTVECWSAISRLRREEALGESDERRLDEILETLSAAWATVEPTTQVKQQAIRSLRVHALGAADSLQLGAALVWAEGAPADHEFVCLDRRLRQAAQLEGFELVPRQIR